MVEYSDIKEIADYIKNSFDSGNNKINITTLFAFNSTGKTRLSNFFAESEEDIALCYNAYLEDLFKWDNENYILKIDPKSWIVRLINEQGLEKDIIDNFSRFVRPKLEPYFNLDKGEISFNIVSGDDGSKENIKISRGEERSFVWSVFYTILETVIDTLNNQKEDRATSEFDELKYIIIDDPISSIDDTMIIRIAINLIDVIRKAENNCLNLLITTHHALFYNVLFNSFRNKKIFKQEKYKNKFFILTREEQKLILKEQNSDSPFGYHLIIKDEIQNAINTDNIKKYHFNLFRSLLEKTANFLGYNNWADCIKDENRLESTKVINLYSHDRLSDLENKELSKESKELFITTFNDFIKEYKWK